MVAGCGRTAPRDPAPPLRHINADSLYLQAVASMPDSLSADAIYLSTALLKPQESMDALRTRVRKDKTTSDAFPLTAVNAMWGAAAWEVYCSTGSRSWLKEAYGVLTSSLRREERLTGSGLQHLSFGIPEYSSAASGYYPQWMNDMDKFQTISTTVNAERANAYLIASLMATEMGLSSGGDYSKEAARIRGAINDRLWLPDLQRYGAYLYGIYYPILNPASDAIANSLCVLFDIATPEMSRALISQMPVTADRIPLLYPGRTEAVNANAQTLFAIAAAKVRNPLAFAVGASALRSLPAGQNNAPGLAALVTRGFFGMRLTPEGITFSPMVPADYPGTKHIDALTYRDATLDINLHGTGDRIASFAIDSVNASAPFFPAGMKGRHRIDITLTGNILTENSVNICEPATAPPMPEVKWTDPLNADIKSSAPDSRYLVFVNGTLHEEIPAGTYSCATRGDETLVIDIAACDKDGNAGVAPRSHIYAPEGNSVTIHASSVTPRRAPLHFIRGHATATNYIELAARHNTRITCYANISADGEYFLTVGYSNGSGRCAMRTLSINERDVDTMICPPGAPTDWVTVHSSNTVAVNLRKGVNKISLTYIQGTMLLNKITLLKKT